MDQPITPSVVLPLLDDAPDTIYEALRLGIGYADNLQPEVESQHFWSHSARFGAWRELRRATADKWSLNDRVPNCGIHLTIGGLHTLRVVRSLGNTVPPPGRNASRRVAWKGINEQLSFGLQDTGEFVIPPLSLLADWRLDEDREPVVHVSLPIGPWLYGQNPRCHWRVPLPSTNSMSLDELSFQGSDGGDPMVAIEIDPAEWAAGTE